MTDLALQLRFWEMSESMGNHDSDQARRIEAGSLDIDRTFEYEPISKIQFSGAGEMRFYISSTGRGV